MSAGNRKFLVVLTGLGMGFLLAVGGFVLAALARLTAEYVAIVSAFAGMVGIAVGAFAAANAVEHWSKREGPPSA